MCADSSFRFNSVKSSGFYCSHISTQKMKLYFILLLINCICASSLWVRTGEDDNCDGRNCHGLNTVCVRPVDLAEPRICAPLWLDFDHLETVKPAGIFTHAEFLLVLVRWASQLGRLIIQGRKTFSSATLAVVLILQLICLFGFYYYRSADRPRGGRRPHIDIPRLIREVAFFYFLSPMHAIILELPPSSS